MSTRQIDKTLLFPIILNLEFTETTYQNILAGLFFIIGHTIRMGFHDEGIVPTVEVQFNRETEEDEQLIKAIEELQKLINNN